MTNRTTVDKKLFDLGLNSLTEAIWTMNTFPSGATANDPRKLAEDALYRFKEAVASTARQVVDPLDTAWNDFVARPPSVKAIKVGRRMDPGARVAYAADGPLDITAGDGKTYQLGSGQYLLCVRSVYFVARDGEWVILQPDGTASILSADEFDRTYRAAEEGDLPEA